MPSIKKVAVANRGEIANRIISTCHEMGLKTVLLYAAGDTENQAFRTTDERICIGPEEPVLSYLNIEKNIRGALGAGAEAIHPGYGFLSENPEFAKACENQGLIFIGPKSTAISRFGNKIEARKLVEKVGVSVLPAWSGNTTKDATLLEKATEVSYPLMIKAACGGGGRGLRLVHDKEEFKSALSMVRSEARESFNSEEIFLEKYLDSARHIEVQIFVSADKEIFILGDRECSLQRRHQKILEESPSNLSQEIKTKMQEACRKICEVLDYQGAGTLEFLFQDGQFYFLEMNTRLQVEHTVTEMIYGVDLLRAQILTAMGLPVFFEMKELQSKGHSIQCRICAEDPKQNFLPATGQLISCQWPQGNGVRVDAGFSQSDKISPYYDSLIGKIIVWEQTRVRAIEKMKRALEETILFGVPTNISFLSFILSHNEFIEHKIKINSLEKIQEEYSKLEIFPLAEKFIQEIFEESKQMARVVDSPSQIFNPWSDFLKK